MKLVDYKKKRSFAKTPEPRGGKGKGKKLLFVIQKHAASRLHYDFRLEMEGVLRSWAVPKGPSVNPADKRLAMLVEDHPFDYKDFEGTIPKGNYGAGTVIIWDQGSYEPLEETRTKAAAEKLLLKGFHLGSLKIRLHGEKLKGEYALIKTPKRADNAWLLIKHRDEYASTNDIGLEDQSVKSGKTLDEVAEDSTSEEWKSNRSANTKTGKSDGPRGKSLYLPGQRTKDWLKIKTVRQQEVVIGGYTRNENSSKLFSALLLGIYRDKTFEYMGPVGTGFTTEMQKKILKKLKPLETKQCPFPVVPDYSKPSRFRPDPPKAEVTWVRPEIVAEVSYRALGSDGTFRHPSFKGLREDKSAKAVAWEEPVAIAGIASENRHGNKPLIAPPAKAGERKSLLNPGDETQVRKIDGHDLKFSNLSKVFWPEMGITKRDMLNYYYQVAPFVLPYVKDRPQTLNRFPNGIHGKSFYQKDVTGKVPPWIQTHAYYSEADTREKQFLVCTNEASLLYIASLGCIEINPWSSRSETPDTPDWCIIDLDPDKNTFNQVVEVARVTKEILDVMGVPSYCKTSGSTGIHIYIPLGAKYTYEESKEFGRTIAKAVHEQVPRFTSIERLTSNRGGKMYIDFLQNRPQATVAGAYSLRPKPGAPVSTPLHWDEVKKGLKITDFNIRNVVPRLRETGDLFEGVLGKGIDIPKALKKLEEHRPDR